jgi:hypothetical protein
MSYGVSVTKSISFRGAAQEFSNTYFYEMSIGTMSQAIAENLLDQVVALEKAIHGNTVSFVRGRVWSAGGTKAENEMIFQKPLSGTGADSNVGSSIDRERAFLVRIRAGQDSRGRPVYLRKWWHLDISAIQGTSISAGQMQNTAPLTTAQRNHLASKYDQFKQITALTMTFNLCSEKGRDITGDTVCHPYLEHHQLGDMWRG